MRIQKTKAIRTVIAKIFIAIHVDIGAWRWQARCPVWPFHELFLNFFMPERIQKPPAVPWGPKQGDGDGGGPKAPECFEGRNTKDLLKKMRQVDPNQSKRYRQRTGQ